MKPIGLLMTEHRLIERMIKVLDKQLQDMKKLAIVDTSLIITGVDFFRTYADRTHHGKEEDILFRELAKKRLSPEEDLMMARLIQEHIWARQAITKLSVANSRYINGDTEVLEQMVYELDKIAKFYPMHIEKEDKHFFLSVMEHFSESEQQDMLEEFSQFDQRLIHEKYRNVVEDRERMTVTLPASSSLR